MLTKLRSCRICKFHLVDFVPCSKTLLLVMLFAFSGCSLIDINPPDTMSCKIQTYVNNNLLDYISKRYDSRLPVRIAVVPFDVPESFAPVGDEHVHFGRTLAGLFQRSMLQTQELPIVELFNRDRWPGKRDEFNAGNYQAIKFARDAGYDLVVLGYMDDIVSARDLSVQTKIIDVNTSVTVWFGRVVASSDERMLRRKLSKVGLSKEYPDRFQLSEKAAEVANCTVAKVVLDATPQ